MSGIYTYNPKDISIALGMHAVSGYADDNFVTIDASGEGISKKVGCDGEIVRNVNPDDTCVVKLVLLKSSATNDWLQKKYAQDIKDGTGTFPIIVKDNKGGEKFTTEAAWVTKHPSRGYGKEAGNIEWEIATASGIFS